MKQQPDLHHSAAVAETLCLRSLHRAVAGSRGMTGLIAELRRASEAEAAVAKPPEPLEASAEWARVQSALMAALRDYPEAEAAVVRAIRGE